MTTSSPNISLKARIMLASFGILMSLIFVEIGLRLVWPQQTYGRVSGATADVFRESEWLVWELTPNVARAQVVEEYGTVTYHVEINSLGFCDDEFTVEPASDVFRIMAVGDSFTYGLGVNQHEDYPSVLEVCLNSRLYGPQHYEVINAGYASGFSPDSYYVFLREIAPPYQPDMVIVGYYVGNDFLDLFDTVWLDEQNGLPGRITSRTRFLDLQGRLTYRNTLPRYRIPVLRDIHVYQIVMELLSEQLHVGFLQGDVPEYAENKVLFRTIYEAGFPPQVQEVFDRSMSMMSAIQTLGDSQGFDVVTWIIPAGEQTLNEDQALMMGFDQQTVPEQANPQHAVREYLDEADIDYFDLLYTLYGHPDTYRGVQGHWTKEGTVVASTQLCDDLINSRLKDALLSRDVTGVKAIVNSVGDEVLIYAHDEQATCDLIAGIGQDDLLSDENFVTSAPCGWSVEVTALEDGYGVSVFDDAGQLRDDRLHLYLTEHASLSFEPRSDFGASTEVAYDLELTVQAQERYEQYLDSQPLTLTGGLVFNPVQFGAIENKLVLTSMIVGQINQGNFSDDEVVELFDLLEVFQTMEFQGGLPLSETGQAAVDDWRENKIADRLRAAGIEYLVVSESWLAWLSEAELAALADTAQYELMQSWQQSGLEPMYLYRVVGES